MIALWWDGCVRVHRHPAVRTDGWRQGRQHGFARWRQREISNEGQLRLLQTQSLAFGTVVQAVVSDLAEAGWQDMQQETFDERKWRESGRARLPRVGVSVTEDDFAVIVMQDGRIGQGHAEDIPGKISECVFSGANRFGMDDPSLTPDGGGHRREEGRMARAQ